MLGTSRPGRYLLTHAPGSERICLFAALPDDPATQQVPALCFASSPLTLPALLLKLLHLSYIPQLLEHFMTVH